MHECDCNSGFHQERIALTSRRKWVTSEQTAGQALRLPCQVYSSASPFFAASRFWCSAMMPCARWLGTIS